MTLGLGCRMPFDAQANHRTHPMAETPVAAWRLCQGHLLPGQPRRGSLNICRTTSACGSEDDAGCNSAVASALQGLQG